MIRERIKASEALSMKPGSKVVVAGWVDRLRIIGKVAFIILRDSSGLIQVVVKKNVSEEAFNTTIELGQEDVVAAKGVLVESKASIGGKEVLAEKIEVLARSEKPLPIDPHDWSKTGLSKRLDWRFLDLRAPRNLLIFKITDELVNSMREFYRSRGFIEVFTPKIVAEATEGGAEVFPVIYFNKTAFLAQSPQLYKQMLMAAGFERVFEVGPAYRAEKHHTVRHLTEYESVDIEMSFIDDHEDVMRIVEEAVKNAIERVRVRYGGLIKEFFECEVETPKYVPRITLKEAVKMLRERGLEYSEYDELDSRGEKELGLIIEEEYGAEMFYLTEFPWRTRPFYTMRKPEEPDYTRSFDLMYRGMEIVSGSQREHRYKILEKQIREKGLSIEGFRFYIDFFKYGAPPHGGAGLGLERLVMSLLKLKNIREARILPRDPERLTP